jgi:uncharacterized protein (DUF488 family)
MPPVLYTTGYEQHPTPATLVAVLINAGVKRLVDVRELPLSRRRGFSKRGLAETVDAAGIRYEHQRALGNPKPLRDLYKSGRAAEGMDRYRAHLRATGASALHTLASTLSDGPVCLLCFERDHRLCHRQVIVEELLARAPSLRVTHLGSPAAS